MELTTARALVTGGGTGIGLATARALRAAGARVAICGRRREPLEAAARDYDLVALVGDVTVEADVERVVAGAESALGGLDVLVNNAGFGRFAPLVEQTIEEFEAQWRTNVLGAMLVARASARRFVAAGGGSIVNVASTAGRRGFAGGGAYCASKFALSALTECWRMELRQHGVRVLQVNPSEVVTDFFDVAGMPRRDDPSKLRADDIAQAIVALLAMPDRAMVVETTVWATNPK